jgi:ABC-type lipoprotein export system ATPase subunit
MAKTAKSRRLTFIFRTLSAKKGQAAAKLVRKEFGLHVRLKKKRKMSAGQKRRAKCMSNAWKKKPGFTKKAAQARQPLIAACVARAAR